MKLVLFPWDGTRSSKVDNVSAFIKVWNPNSWPVQVDSEGRSIPGFSEGEVDLDEKLAQGALASGLVNAVGNVVVPAEESQVADSAEAETMSNAPVSAEDETPAEDSFQVEDDADGEVKATKSTRTKSQASKES